MERLVGFRELFVLIGFGMVTLLLTIFVQYHTARITLHLDLESEQSGELKVYWRARGEYYDENRAWKTSIYAGNQASIAVMLPPISQIDYIRIDLINRPALLRIDKATLTFRDELHTNLLDARGLKALQEGQQLRLVPNKAATELEALGEDSYFEIKFSPIYKKIFQWPGILGILALSITILCFSISQFLVKGSLFSGFLQITLPHKDLPLLPQKMCIQPGLIPRFSYRENDTNRIYSLHFKQVQPDMVVDLVRLVRQANPESDVRFQYNRSGEVA